MRCEEARQWLGAWRDGELASTEGQAIADHVAQCPACAEEERVLRRLGSALLRLRATAPDGLRQRLHAAVASEGPGNTPHEIERAGGRRGWSRAAATRAIAATAVIAACMGWLSAYALLPGEARQTALHRDVVTAHMRALATDTNVQIAAADSHVVKPWFAGRVDFAPSVRDLSQDGFALIGARIDIVDGRRVGVAVYKRRLHTISVFMWPADHASPRAADRQAVVVRGYNLLSWSKDGVVYWAASDLNAAELSQLPPLL
jgi:anti-sigma factor RsiW